jgi:3-oxoacyl-[acyl-carrier-protein] synthase-3
MKNDGRITMSQYSAITGWGKYLPQHVLTNADLERMVDTSDEWIVARTGIRERRIAGPEETTAFMAVAAARQALARAEVLATDLDLIIVATTTPDHPAAAVASAVQVALGACCGTCDLNAACSGFVYALAVAHQFIAVGPARHVLVIGADALTRLIDFTDRNTCVLFGDAAGAIVLSARDRPGGLSQVVLGADGSGCEQLYVPAGGSKAPLTQELLAAHQQFLKMDGREVFKFAARVVAPSIAEAAARAGIPQEAIDLVVLHQANIRIIDTAVKRLSIDPAKVFVNLDRYGNTVAASVPVALCEAAEQGLLWPGAHVALVGFGAGLAWGATIVHWTEPTGANDAESRTVLLARGGEQ